MRSLHCNRMFQTIALGSKSHVSLSRPWRLSIHGPKAPSGRLGYEEASKETYNDSIIMLQMGTERTSGLLF